MRCYDIEHLLLLVLLLLLLLLGLLVANIAYFYIILSLELALMSDFKLVVLAWLGLITLCSHA